MRFGRGSASVIATALLSTGCMGAEREGGTSQPALYEVGADSYDYDDVSISSMPEVQVDISAIPPLAEKIAQRTVASLVRIATADYHQGSGVMAGETRDRIGSVLTAGHVISELWPDGAYLPPCSDIFVFPRHGDVEVFGRSAAYDGDFDITRKLYSRGKIELDEVVSPTTDIANISVDNLSPKQTSLEYEFDSSFTEPGDVLYVVAPKDGTSFDEAVVFPVIVQHRMGDRIHLITGIGEDEHDDVVSGMSGAPIVTPEGKVAAVVTEGSSFRTSTDELQKSYAFDTTSGDLYLTITGSSADGEEYDEIIDQDEQGTMVNKGTGFTTGAAQLVTTPAYLDAWEQPSHFECEASVPVYIPAE